MNSWAHVVQEHCRNVALGASSLPNLCSSGAQDLRVKAILHEQKAQKEIEMLTQENLGIPAKPKVHSGPQLQVAKVPLYMTIGTLAVLAGLGVVAVHSDMQEVRAQLAAAAGE